MGSREPLTSAPQVPEIKVHGGWIDSRIDGKWAEDGEMDECEGRRELHGQIGRLERWIDGKMKEERKREGEWETQCIGKLCPAFKCHLCQTPRLQTSATTLSCCLTSSPKPIWQPSAPPCSLARDKHFCWVISVSPMQHSRARCPQWALLFMPGVLSLRSIRQKD